MIKIYKAGDDWFLDYRDYNNRLNHRVIDKKCKNIDKLLKEIQKRNDKKN